MINKSNFSKVGSESLGSVACSHFIPTPTLTDIFEEAHQSMQNENALKLLSALSWHPLTRTAAGWAHELKMHKHLSSWGPPLTITQTSGPASEIRPSSRLLQGILEDEGWMSGHRGNECQTQSPTEAQNTGRGEGANTACDVCQNTERDEGANTGCNLCVNTGTAMKRTATNGSLY